MIIYFSNRICHNFFKKNRRFKNYMEILTFDHIKDEVSKSEIVFSRGENIFNLGNYRLVEEKSEAGKYNYKFDGSYGDYDVSISLKDNSFSSKCSCPFPHKGCKHVVAACLDIVQRHKREKKSSSDDDIPQEYMTPEEVREKAIKGRNDKAKKEDFQLLRGDQYKGSHIVRTKRYHDYEVTLYNPAERSGHCICPDFATNHLETCKHLIFAYNQFEKDKNFTEETGKEIFPFIHLTWNSRLQKPVSNFEKIDDSEVKKSIDILQWVKMILYVLKSFF
jgi:hypothetical protein